MFMIKSSSVIKNRYTAFDKEQPDNLLMASIILAIGRSLPVDRSATADLGRSVAFDLSRSVSFQCCSRGIRGYTGEYYH